MFTQNLHAHSTFDDGRSTLEDMVRAAIAAGLSSIGFSVHLPMCFHADWACPPDRLPCYMDEVRCLRQRYAGQIDVFLGAEWDVLSSVDLSPFDYAIGSAHHLPLRPIDAPDLTAADFPAVDHSAATTARILADHYAGDADAMARDYFREVKKVAANPQVLLVGHFDLLTKFDEQHGFFSPMRPAYRAAALDAMETLVRAGKIFEVNTGAIARGYRTTPYPARELLCALREMGGRVTLSADAHHASGVACAYELAERIVRECGFDSLWKLTREQGTPVFLPET